MKNVSLTLTNILSSIELKISKAKTLLKAKSAELQTSSLTQKEAPNEAAEPAAE